MASSSPCKQSIYFARLRSAALVSVASFAVCAPALGQLAVQTLQKHVRPEVVSGKAELVGAVSPGQQLNFSIVLPLRNEPELASLLSRLYDPASPDYRRFISVAQFTAEFGPTAADYQAVVAFASANGFTITGAPANRLVVPLRGTAEQIGNAFHLSMNLYRHPAEDRTFYSPDREPTLDLSVPVRHIVGLNNYSIPHPMLVRPKGQAQAQVDGSGFGGAYLASDMRAAYYGGTTLTGNGQSVGLVEFGGYDINDVNLTFSSAGQSYTVPVNNVLLDGASGGIEDDYDAEQVLDIVQAIGMAPALSQVRVYIGTGQDDANILNSMASENIAKELSCSWSWGPEDPTTDDVFFKEFAAQGQSFLAASGDNGAYYAQISPYFYPSEDAYVTSVGGTHMTTTGPGGSWASESAWNSASGGSGGGVSPDQIPIPSWQTPAINAANAGSLLYRNVPDIAMEGDADNYFCTFGYCYEDGAGTSFAAPRWAAFLAMVNQQAVEAGNAPSGGIGFVNPSIYAIGAGSRYSQEFHDITVGNNDVANQPVWYSAVTGYDLVTGWGSAAGQSLIDDLAGKQVPGFWIAATAPVVSLAQGGSATTTLNVTGAADFSGSVSLAITSALPSGVTASWAPNPTTASSVLTLKASATAAASVALVSITGTSGKLTATTNISVAVRAPTFTVSSSPASLLVSPGAPATASVAITPVYGFAGNVTLTASNLPTGVSASFSPNPSTGASTATFTATSAAAGGTYPITITGTSGTVRASGTLSLTVAVPTFTLTALASLAIGQGTSSDLYISVGQEFGFIGNVKLSVSGLPSGITASFSPNPATQTSVLTLTASTIAPLGTSTLTITGTYGSITRTATVSLGVFAPSFSLTVPQGLTLGLGKTASAFVSINPMYGFTGSVNLSISGLPSGVTASFTPNPVVQSATLTLSASSSTPLGTSVLKITGMSGTQSLTLTVPLAVKVPTFTISAGPDMSLGQGSSSLESISINPDYGFTDSANLAISGLPSGVTASFLPNPTNGSSLLSLTATPTAAIGTFNLTITGTSGSQSASAGVALSVGAPSFTLATLNPLTVGTGSSAQTGLSVIALNGFSGSVNFTLSGLPTGVTASISPNPGIGYSTLVFSAASTAAVGSSTITVTGTSGSLKSTTSMILSVAAPSFSLTTSSPLALGQGASTTTYVYITPQNGFSSNVSLVIQGLPRGVTASFSSNPAIDASIITLTAASTIALGTYPLRITGTSGSVSQTIPLSLSVVAPSFTIGTYGGSINLGRSGSQTAYFYVTAQNGFNSNVTLAASGLPSGVTASFVPNPAVNQSIMTLSASSTAVIGSAMITITGTSGSQSATTTIPLSVSIPGFTVSEIGDIYVSPASAATTSVYIQPNLNFSANVTLSISGLPTGVTAAFSPNPIFSDGESTMTITAGSAAVLGDYPVTVKGTSGSLTASTQFVLHLSYPAFEISPPNSVAVGRGSSTTGYIYAYSQNGLSLAGTTYGVSGLPSGVTASFTPNPTTSDGSTALLLQASSTAALGQYNIKVAAKIGAATQTALVPLTVGTPTFSISGAGSATIGQGASETSTVYIQPIDGFTGNVNLSVSGLPSGVTASFSQNPVNVTSQGATVTVNLNASSTAALGQYAVTVNAASGTQTASFNTSIGVYAPLFSFEYGIASATVSPGSTNTTAIYISQAYGFTAGVNLSVTGLPSGVTASFSPNPTTGTSMLTLTAASTASQGQYLATITGNSGKQTATTLLSLTVTAPSFYFSASNSFDLGRGATTQGLLFLYGQNGFNGNVTFSFSGLPAGVTASISPNPSPATTSPSITLTATSGAPFGDYPFTITGKSGSLTASTKAVVSVHPAAFTLNTQNAVVLGRGTSGTSYVGVNSQYGFTGSVTLSISGLPSGVTASFAPNPTTGDSTITMTAGSTASLGEYPVTITGTSGSQTASATFVLGVYQPTFTIGSNGYPALDQGTSFQSEIYIEPVYGFTGNVGLAITGLPAGVTATFSANPVASSSGSTLLTLTAASNAPIGLYNLTVTGTSGSQKATTTIPLTIQVAPPVTYPVYFTPASIKFPSTALGLVSAEEFITLYNPGNAPLFLKSFALSGANAGEFSALSKTCGTSLPAYGTCQLGIVFTPTSLGAATATLSAVDNATNTPQTVALSATATKVAATVSQLDVDFPTTAVGATSSAQTVTLTNPGTLPLVISSIVLGDKNSQYEIVSNNCGSSLAARSSCAVQVALHPNTAGTAYDELVFTDDAGNSPQGAELIGTAVNSSLTLAPASIPFPATAVGAVSAPQTITLSNPGTIAMTVRSFTFSGANAAEFEITGKTCGTSLAAGASCTLQIAFKPTAAGAADAIFEATDSAGNSPQEVSLSGSTSAAITATLSPSTLTFSATAVGATSATQTATFTNTSSSAMSVSSFTFSGANAAEFVIAGKNCGSSLAAGASCTLLLAFKPNSAGTASANFKATDNAVGSPQSISLAGTGH